MSRTTRKRQSPAIVRRTSRSPLRGEIMITPTPRVALRPRCGLRSTRGYIRSPLRGEKAIAGRSYIRLPSVLAMYTDVTSQTTSIVG